MVTPREAISRTISKIFATIRDRKSTRLNSSHLGISYAVFCLKKKKEKTQHAAQHADDEDQRETAEGGVAAARVNKLVVGRSRADRAAHEHDHGDELEHMIRRL